MKTSDMIRQLCEQMNISVSELARRLGQSPQNFGKKLKRETITLEELLFTLLKFVYDFVIFTTHSVAIFKSVSLG